MEKRQKTTTTVTTSTTAESGGAARTAVTATQSGMSIGFGAGRWEFTAASLEAREHAELPTDRLVQAPLDGLEPVVVVSCGSFSPPTLMHLRILEDAKDHLQSTGKYAVVGGYISPCHAAYGKASLVDMHHRLNMCQAAVADSSWLMVDAWECCQSEWTRTAVVLRELGNRLPEIDGRKVKVMMVCGGDLLESFTVIKEDGEPLWSLEDQQIILAENGVACLEREGVDLAAVIKQHEILRKNCANIEIVTPAATNNISSTLVRKQLRENHSVKYLVPDAVAEYVAAEQLATYSQWQ